MGEFDNAQENSEFGKARRESAYKKKLENINTSDSHYLGSPRDSLKYFKTSVPRHNRFAEERKKSNKPLMEKKRRARINDCLVQLKTLVLQAMQKDNSQYSKLEKADILEMTVKHLSQLQRYHVTSDYGNLSLLSKYRVGFNECANEVVRYLTGTNDVGYEIRTRLLNHLASCLETWNYAGECESQSGQAHKRYSQPEPPTQRKTIIETCPIAKGFPPHMGGEIGLRVTSGSNDHVNINERVHQQFSRQVINNVNRKCTRHLKQNDHNESAISSDKHDRKMAIYMSCCVNGHTSHFNTYCQSRYNTPPNAISELSYCTNMSQSHIKEPLSDHSDVSCFVDRSQQHMKDQEHDSTCAHCLLGLSLDRATVSMTVQPSSDRLWRPWCQF